MVQLSAVGRADCFRECRTRWGRSDQGVLTTLRHRSGDEAHTRTVWQLDRMGRNIWVISYLDIDFDLHLYLQVGSTDTAQILLTNRGFQNRGTSNAQESFWVVKCNCFVCLIAHFIGF